MTQFEKDIASPHRDLFEEARAFLLAIEGVEEVRKTRVTTYMIRGKGLCHMRTMPHGIDFGFLKGAALDDPSGRLTGSGKTLRVLSLDQFDADLVQFFATQAVALLRD